MKKPKPKHWYTAIIVAVLLSLAGYFGLPPIVAELATDAAVTLIDGDEAPTPPAAPLAAPVTPTAPTPLLLP